MASSRRAVWTCNACLRAAARQQAHTPRTFTSKTKPTDQSDGQEEQGALSRRLQQMAEETIDTGSSSDRRTIETTGFSDELKSRLEQRIAESTFQSQNQQALSQATMPSAAGKGTRDHAAAQPWSGTEALPDAALRMLDDSHKRIRMPARKPTLSSAGPKSMKPAPKKKVSVADRLANARDKTSVYTLTREQQNSMSEEEKEAYKKELRDRFSPGARPMPTTLQGLTSLANERIEDAIARGQFKNIQRGKGVNIERDYNANSPFLDTTEYFMNKIIQKQEIVPPWIEKQQELMKMVNVFRKRLRNDWRRHAARTISSKGGSVEDQVRRAQGYALAEEAVNPRPTVRQEEMASIDATGMLRTVTVEERIAAGVPVEQPPSIEIKVTETQHLAQPAATEPETEENILRQMQQQDSPQPEPVNTTSTNTATIQIEPAPPAIPADTPRPQPTASPVLPMPYPFRDPAWEQAESAYHTLAINEINATARSYNLMAPKIAQKPYHSLDRELKRCYAEVAPLLADEILERSRKPVVKIAVSMHKPGGVMEKLGAGREYAGHQTEKIRDEGSEKGYGFKEFWRDLFAKDDKPRQPV